MSVFGACPIYVHGLTVTLGDKGFAVRDVTRSPLSSRWFTDVFLIDLATLQDMTLDDLLAMDAPAAPVTVLVDDTSAESIDGFVRAGVAGVLDHCAPVNIVAEGLRAVAGGKSFIGTSVAADISGRPGPGPQPDEPDALSPRELQVLTQIARGLTHRQGARALGISQHTFDTYIKRIRSKLGVGNKAELTRAAVMRDLGRAS
ncbi:response regulator transcription factor [Plantactinospora mayteni]|uniref:response regulator transcription factor n=1 Tax=Plantactinospora mayteni TaxID=566021 RepID=UPI001942ED10|nr:response regulator transcription factor [Plantactinospora mayteni]